MYIRFQVSEVLRALINCVDIETEFHVFRTLLSGDVLGPKHDVMTSFLFSRDTKVSGTIIILSFSENKLSHLLFINYILSVFLGGGTFAAKGCRERQANNLSISLIYWRGFQPRSGTVLRRSILARNSVERKSVERQNRERLLTTFWCLLTWQIFNVLKGHCIIESGIVPKFMGSSVYVHRKSCSERCVWLCTLHRKY